MVFRDSHQSLAFKADTRSAFDKVEVRVELSLPPQVLDDPFQGQLRDGLNEVSECKGENNKDKGIDNEGRPTISGNKWQRFQSE